MDMVGESDLSGERTRSENDEQVRRGHEVWKECPDGQEIRQNNIKESREDESLVEGNGDATEEE